MTINQIECRREGLFSFLRRKRRIQKLFKEKFGYRGNFASPKTLEEKAQFRKLWGNHDFYAMVADKFLVREYVASIVGDRYLIPLLGVYDRLTPDIFISLPCQFIIKANHGCKWHQIVWDKSTLDIDATCRDFDRYLSSQYGEVYGEYHYNRIKPKVVIEKLLVDQDDVPCDYNYYCHNSDHGFDYMHAINRNERGDATHFDKEWNIIDGTALCAEESKRYTWPENHEEMLSVSKALSRDFDFVRIDLYNVEGKIYFGEITLTPAAGLQGIKNKQREKIRNDMWKLDKENRLLYQEPSALSRLL